MFLVIICFYFSEIGPEEALSSLKCFKNFRYTFSVLTKFLILTNCRPSDAIYGNNCRGDPIDFETEGLLALRKGEYLKNEILFHVQIKK